MFIETDFGHFMTVIQQLPPRGRSHKGLEQHITDPLLSIAGHGTCIQIRLGKIANPEIQKQDSKSRTPHIKELLLNYIVQRVQHIPTSHYHHNNNNNSNNDDPSTMYSKPTVNLTDFGAKAFRSTDNKPVNFDTKQ